MVVVGLTSHFVCRKLTLPSGPKLDPRGTSVPVRMSAVISDIINVASKVIIFHDYKCFIF